jgi:hypothetical protein
MKTATLLLGLSLATLAQDHQHHQPDPAKPPAQQDGHAHHHGGSTNAAVDFLFRQSSGTVMQPAAWPMPMLMNSAGKWQFMWMGQAFIAATQQSGPRGADKVYAPNWGMVSAVRPVGKGAFMLRLMPTLEPATVTGRSYPLLFQTGEAAFGRPLVDAQHPHELIMELSAQYARPIGENTVFNIYWAPVGDAAFGPVAFPHRASAMELPQATLAHHWQDSTHIANNVLTVGIGNEKVRLEGSGYRGQEPNENRWNIDLGAMDSWSTRLSVFPTRNWSAQVSTGRIKRPEQFHADDVVRATASLHHVVPRTNGNYIATSFIWARNYKTIEKHASHAVVAETLIPAGRKNFFTGRFDWAQRDELFENDHELAHEIEHETGKHAFNVASYTAGYTRDIGTFRNMQTGIGANFTVYQIASELKRFYGDTPKGVTFFLRVRLKPEE